MNSLNSFSTRPSSLLAVVFALTTFWCSALIFWVQPLVGKQLLPLLGGAPAVWNICLVFFQVALLAGYALAHGLARLRRIYLQVAIYVAILLLGLAMLPAGFPLPPANPEHPAAWLFLQLVRQLGLPLIALTAAAPLVQHWYAHAPSNPGRDPYFLYAASNAGSLLALLAYPVVIEPAWSIHTQNAIWAAMYIVGIIWLALAFATGRPVVTDRVLVAATPKPGWRDYARWLTLAAIPSSLLFGVTSYLTADLAPIPLLWVVPLALYLSTFVIAFGWSHRGPPVWLVRAIVLLAAAWTIVYRLQPTDPIWLLSLIHLLFFTALALGIHSRLAASRPAPEHLTRFYLALALGGALGGAFNVLVAPNVFDSFAEYPIVALLGVFLATRRPGEKPSLMRDAVPALILGLVTLALVLWPELQMRRTLAGVVTVGLPAFVAYALSERSTRFVLALAAVLLTVVGDSVRYNRVVEAERNFYGLVRATRSRSGRFLELRHGNTLHGAADRQQAGGSEPLTYYSLAGPIADVFNDVQSRPDVRNFAVVGLGVGSLAYYANRGESWDFYEINPAVERMARDSSMFGFLHRSKAASIRIIPGDARLSLRTASDSTYDVMVLDAFTSDAIPLHLLTREAVQLYFRKVKPHGLVAFHTSNRYLDFAPVLGDIARSLGLVAIARDDWIKTKDERAKRIEGSSWVVLAGAQADLGAVGRNPRWYRVAGAHKRVWTDDYSNLWSAWE